MSYPLAINVFPKRRGQPTGPDLLSTKIQDLVITKRIGSRILGQLWVLSGAFLGSILATAKILFSILCTFLDDWSSPLQDEELKSQYVDFLTALTNRYNSLEASSSPMGAMQ